MVDKITDHEARALALFPDQFQEKPNITKLNKVFSKQIQELENVAFAMLTNRFLTLAEGQQLDGLGEIVGEDRDGRTDAIYKTALGTRISINRSNGEPETLINVLASLTNATDVKYKELYPASVEMTTNGTSIPTTLSENMHKVRAAGVALTIIHAGGTLNPFVFENDPDGAGFGEYGESVGGEFLEVIVS